MACHCYIKDVSVVTTTEERSTFSYSSIETYIITKESGALYDDGDVASCFGTFFV